MTTIASFSQRLAQCGIDFISPNPSLKLIEKIELGAALGIADFTCQTGISLGISSVHSYFTGKRITKYIEKFPIPTALKVKIIVDDCLLGPLIEEFYFRVLLYSAMKFSTKILGLPESTDRILRIVANGLLFGMAHNANETKLQNKIIVVTSSIISGFLLSSLKEKTGGMLAPFIAHASNNLLALSTQRINLFKP